MTRGYVVLTCELRREEDQWLGECLELGTATFGDTFDEVVNELADLVPLHVNGLEELGERERFFEEHDIHVFPEAPEEVARTIPTDGSVTIAQSVPIPVALVVA